MAAADILKRGGLLAWFSYLGKKVPIEKIPLEEIPSSWSLDISAVIEPSIHIGIALRRLVHYFGLPQLEGVEGSESTWEYFFRFQSSSFSVQEYNGNRIRVSIIETSSEKENEQEILNEFSKIVEELVNKLVTIKSEIPGEPDVTI